MPEINEVLYEEIIKINNDMPIHEFNKYLKDIAVSLSEKYNIHVDDILTFTNYTDTEDSNIQQLQILATYVPTDQKLVFVFKPIHGQDPFLFIKHKEKINYEPNSVDNLNLLLQARTRYLRGIQKLQEDIRNGLEIQLHDDISIKNFNIEDILPQKLITNHMRLKIRYGLVYI